MSQPLKTVAIVCEGQTEVSFVQSILADYLSRHSVIVQPVIVKTATNLTGNRHRGGGGWTGRPGTGWEHLISGLLHVPSYDIVTTLIDWYGFPANGPIIRDNKNATIDEVEAGMAEIFHNDRFVPFIVLHELETYVIAALAHNSSGKFARMQAAAAAWIRDAHGAEHINNDPNRKPSQRLRDCWNQNDLQYVKTITPLDIFQTVPFDVVLEECPRLQRWVTTLTGT